MNIKITFSIRIHVHTLRTFKHHNVMFCELKQILLFISFSPWFVKSVVAISNDNVLYDCYLKGCSLNIVLGKIKQKIDWELLCLLFNVCVCVFCGLQ